MLINAHIHDLAIFLILIAEMTPVRESDSEMLYYNIIYNAGSSAEWTMVMLSY